MSLKAKKLINKRNYDADHRLAKIITWGLINVITILSLVLPYPFGVILALITINTAFIFGVNFVAHIIETIRKHRHNHKWL